MAAVLTRMPCELELFDCLQSYTPECIEEVQRNFKPPPFLKPDASEDEKAQHKERSARYVSTVKHAFKEFIAGRDSAVYLGLQPMFGLQGGTAGCYRLSGFEVLVRVKNGEDGAPMPGMALWQAQDLEGSAKFCCRQFDFAVQCSLKVPGIDVSVNVRPDELSLVREKILESVSKARDVIVEITEYAPITEEVVALIRQMKSEGVRFSLDDVTKVVDQPMYGYAKTGTHACSFEFGKRYAELFEVQKLSLPLAAFAWRRPVFPTPAYAGGVQHPFFAKLIIPHEKGQPVPAEIFERKREIEDWVREVKQLNKNTKFIIECSLHEEDLEGKQDLLPDLKLFDGDFSMQGGLFGGRCFPPEVMFAHLPELKLSDVNVAGMSGCRDSLRKSTSVNEFNRLHNSPISTRIREVGFPFGDVGYRVVTV